VATPSAGQDSAALRILVADPIAADGVERLRAAGEVDVATGLTPEQLIARIAGYDALVVRSETKVTADLLAMAKRLRVVGRAGVGVDNIDIEAATRHGVLVLNAPTGNTIAAAEHAVAMMLALARNIPAADASLRAGRWERSRLVGVELRERTLGLVGLGKIGSQMAPIARAFELDVIAWSPNLSPERAAAEGVESVSKERLFAEADIVSIHLVLSDRTRGLIGRDDLARMKPTAYLVNTSRGPIVDEAALLDALRDGTIAGAGLDVFGVEPLPVDDPLRSAPNTVLTPHIGYVAAGVYEVWYREIVEDIEAFHHGEPVRVIAAPRH
jgi:D-3-phosphoglycerate dehydrogenase